VSSGQGVITTLWWWSRLLGRTGHRRSGRSAQCSDRFCDSGHADYRVADKRPALRFTDPFRRNGNRPGTPRFDCLVCSDGKHYFSLALRPYAFEH